MALTTIFLNSFETIFLILVLVTLFRIRKHYLLSSQLPPKARQKPRQKESRQSLKNRPEKTLSNQPQSKLSSNHYFRTLPEPEVSIATDMSSDNETDYSIDYAIEVSPEPTQTALKPSGTRKSILHNYIDDFFVETPIEPTFSKEHEFIPYHARSAENS